MHDTKQTVVFLRKNKKICLAQKKEDIHNKTSRLEGTKGVWNGYGGSLDETDKDILHCAVREVKEESDVDLSIHELIPAGRICFHWPVKDGKSNVMEVYFFFADHFSGEPKETKEGKMGPPKFFSRNEIPYEEMMPGDRLLIPRMLDGEFVQGRIYLGKTNSRGEPLFIETA